MSDEKIINFADIKNRITEEDVDAFEAFMSKELLNLDLNPELDMVGFANKISEYQERHNISNEKFMEIQTKMIERYGFTASDDNLMQQEKKATEELNKRFRESDTYIYMSAIFGLNAIFDDKVEEKRTLQLDIKNDKNDLRMIFSGTTVTIISEKKIDLSDDNINKAISRYRESAEKTIRIQICEASNAYDYQ